MAREGAQSFPAGHLLPVISGLVYMCVLHLQFIAQLANAGEAVDGQLPLSSLGKIFRSFVLHTGYPHSCPPLPRGQQIETRREASAVSSGILYRRAFGNSRR